jgi:hypothetical protein
MTAPRWNPPIEITKPEERIMRRLTRHGKLFAFLRLQRHALFDDTFEAELIAMYRDSGAGKDPVAPAMLAMVTVLQAYAKVSDAEAVERATFDARWQMVLGVLGQSEPPFSQGALVAFRDRLIEHDMDRRLLERTIEFARSSKGFDYKKLPKSSRLAVDSRPLSGAGRVEDTINLLGRAGRHLLVAAAKIAGKSADDLAEEVGADLLLESSIKAALDIDWNAQDQKTAALAQLLSAIEALEVYVREKLPTDATRPPIADHLKTLAKLREQDLDPDPPDGAGPRIRDGVAPDRTISLSEGEMRHGRKSKNRTFNGYKSHLVTDLDDDVVLACAVLPANRPESEGLDAMDDDLERVIGDRSSRVKELHTDRAYTKATVTQRFMQAGTEVLTKPRTSRGKPGMFEKPEFTIDLVHKTATCPDGQTIPITIGKVARFDPARCDRCSIRSVCTTAAPGKGRSLSIAEDEEVQNVFSALVKTPDGRARLRERVAIEHTLARHRNIQGTRARYRGTRKNLFDSRRTASVYNIESAHRHRERALKAQETLAKVA